MATIEILKIYKFVSGYQTRNPNFKFRNPKIWILELRKIRIFRVTMRQVWSTGSRQLDNDGQSDMGRIKSDG